MQFLVKEPGSWTWKTITTDSLEAEVKNGRVRPDWRIRLEGEAHESTVDQLLALLKTSAAAGDKTPINLDDVIVLGINRHVTAISKIDGRILWSTELLGALGSAFVTLLIDGERIFAGCGGHLSCLDLTTGRLLWTNELKGYGYGLVSLCRPGGKSSPAAEVIQAVDEEAARRAG